MEKLIELRINSVVERTIAAVIDRELDEDTYLYFNSKELVLFIASTLFQTLAQPIVADAYEYIKEIIIEKSEEIGVPLTEEDTKRMFDDTFQIMAIENKLDESWRKKKQADGE